MKTKEQCLEVVEKQMEELKHVEDMDRDTFNKTMINASLVLMVEILIDIRDALMKNG